MEIVSREDAIKQGLTHFFTGKPCKVGHISKSYVKGRRCFECAKIAAREVKREKSSIKPENYRYELTKEERLLRSINKRKEYVVKNIDKIREIKRKNKAKHSEKYKKSAALRMKEKRKNNPTFRLNRNISKEVWAFMKGKKQGKTWKSFIDYDTDSLIKHIENKFDENMTWENYGKYWELDHIVPLNNFKDPDMTVNIKNAWKLDNLQPLELYLNRSKCDKYVGTRLKCLEVYADNKRKPVQKDLDKHIQIIKISTQLLNNEIYLNYIQLDSLVSNLNKLRLDFDLESRDFLDQIQIAKAIQI